MKPLTLGVLASGRGSALSRLIPAIQNHTLFANIELIISDQALAPVLAHQQKYGIETLYVDPQGKSRTQHERLITQEFRAHQVDLILLVGYMRILSPEFVNEWRGKIINVHPSLLPAFAGLANLKVHRAVLAANSKESGCTAHLVNEEVDGGPIILQKRCAVLPDETPETLKAKVQALEGELLLEAVQEMLKHVHL